MSFTIGTSYLMDIPKEYGADIPKESLGKWCFNKLSGRRWPLIYRDGSYELDIQGLGQEKSVLGKKQKSGRQSER